MFLTFGVDLHAVRHHAGAMRVSASRNGRFQIRRHDRRPQMVPVLVDVDFQAGVFQIDDGIDRLAEGKAGKTLRRRSH